MPAWAFVLLVAFCVFAGAAYALAYVFFPPLRYSTGRTDTPEIIKPPELDRAAYDAKMIAISGCAALMPHATSTPDSTSQATTTGQAATTSATCLYPVKAPYPQYGAILPFKRIVAYYGNYLSRQMGVLGEYDHDDMVAKLKRTVALWEAADPSTPVMPAIDYIAITAQGSPGKDGMYRLRMPDSEMQQAIEDAREVNGIVIIDIQVGKSTLQQELPLLKDFLKLPQVHLAIDPEFSMKTGAAPGHVIGTFDAGDVNYAARFLANLVDEYHLPPKILVVHRFTADMVTRAPLITPLPQVQIVMDMDGWGEKARKIGTYTRIIYPEPVQFTGFKLFYKNDLKPPSTGMMTPAEVLKLKPQPMFIQYQ